jgi:hypothetical protein
MEAATVMERFPLSQAATPTRAATVGAGPTAPLEAVKYSAFALAICGRGAVAGGQSSFSRRIYGSGFWRPQAPGSARIAVDHAGGGGFSSSGWEMPPSYAHAAVKYSIFANFGRQLKRSHCITS